MSKGFVVVNGIRIRVNKEGELHLDNLEITNIHEINGLDKLKYLKGLNLKDNNISEIEGLDNLTELEYLNLGNNQITVIKGLEKLGNLQRLYLGDNSIIKIIGLSKLSILETLNLDNNPIVEELDQELGINASIARVIQYSKKKESEIQIVRFNCKDPDLIKFLEERMKYLKFKNLIYFNSGQTACIYKIQNESDKTYILKIHQPDDIINRGDFILKKINHDNVIKLERNAIFETPYLGVNLEYSILEFFEGIPLNEGRLFLEHRELSYRLRCAIQLIKALKEIYSIYSNHGDLHEGNILISKNPKSEILVKLIDPGQSSRVQNIGNDIDNYKDFCLLYFFTNSVENDKYDLKKIESFDYIYQILEFLQSIMDRISHNFKEIDKIKPRCFESIKEIMHFCITHFDYEANKPKESIPVGERSNIRHEVSYLGKIRDDAKEWKIDISSGWSNQKATHHISIKLFNNILIDIKQHDYGKAMKAGIKVNGEYNMDLEFLEENVIIPLRFVLFKGAETPSARIERTTEETQSIIIKNKKKIKKIQFLFNNIIDLINYLKSDDYWNSSERIDEKIRTKEQLFKKEEKKLVKYFGMVIYKANPSAYDIKITILEGRYTILLRNRMPYEPTINKKGRVKGPFKLKNNVRPAEDLIELMLNELNSNLKSVHNIDLEISNKIKTQKKL